MSPVSFFDLLECAAALAGVAFLFRAGREVLRRDIRCIVVALLLLSFVHGLSNVLEWTGVTDALDVFSDYGEILTPILWGVLIYALLKDVAARRLRQSEERFRSLAETTGDWVWEVGNDMVFTYCSPGVEALLGYSPDELVGRMTPFDLMADGEDERMRAVYPRPAAAHAPVANIEHVCRHKNGSQVALETNRTPVFDADGRLSGYRGVDRDVTARKKAEARLRSSEERYRAITSTAQDAIVMIDSCGRINFWNPAAESIFGYTLDEAMGRDLHTLLAPEKYHAAYRQGIKQFMVCGQGPMIGRTVELTGIRKCGTEFPVELSLSAIQKGNGWQGIGIARDVSQRKQAEKELRKHRLHLEELVRQRTAELVTANAQLQEEIEERKRAESELLKNQNLDALGLLAGGIAHDFNNLLTAIIGNLSIAKVYAEPGELIALRLGDIQKAASRARELTRQLLTFAKGGTPVRRLSSLPALLRDSTRFILRGSNVDCEFQLPEDLWPVMVDESQISQVHQNLVLNADQAMPDGGVITVRACNIELKRGQVPSLKPGRYVQLTVEDQGCGIAAEHFGRVFEPYFTTKERGSGLGLAICHTIINNHNGTILAHSRDGGGTTFHVYLPASSEEQLVATDAGDADGIVNRGKVLVMDDDEIVKEVAVIMLHSLGCEADAVNDGHEAIERYMTARSEQRPYDAVILDLTIPGGMGGKVAARKLRELDPTARLIVSSGYVNDPVLLDFRNYGFAGVLPKPYELADMGKALFAVLGSSHC